MVKPNSYIIFVKLLVSTNQHSTSRSGLTDDESEEAFAAPKIETFFVTI
jgi:hypothetical protein